MDHRQTENFYIIVSPGLEMVCAEELSDLGIPPLEITTGGVGFAGSLRDLYLANLWLRTASRVLVRFAEFRCRDFPDLYQRARRLPWGRFIRPESPVSFRVTCHASRLNHTTRIAETLGFDEATNFIKFFKRDTGCTPAAFRRLQGAA